MLTAVISEVVNMFIRNFAFMLIFLKASYHHPIANSLEKQLMGFGYFWVHWKHALNLPRKGCVHTGSPDPP